MSDLATAARLRQASSQLPASWYCDSRVFEAERRLLFDGPRDIARDLAGLTLGELDFTGYRLGGVDLHPCRYNWKTFIEVYLEDYHVGPFHPGLGQFVNADDLKWEFGDWYSVQTVGINQALGKPGTAAYQKWHEAVLRYNNGEMPTQGAIWLTYYPNIMVEWYPNVLVVSTFGYHSTMMFG